MFNFVASFDTSFTLNDLWFMIKGAGTTLALTFWAVLGGTLLGAAFGVARASLPWWLNAPIGFVLDIFRSVPLLIQFVLANSFKSIVGLNWGPFTVGCVVLAAYTAAYCTEIVRAGILAVPTTTRRAARSLGMTWGQDLISIAFPIALRVALPSFARGDEGHSARSLDRNRGTATFGADHRDADPGAAFRALLGWIDLLRDELPHSSFGRPT
jgi:hydroxyproline transport system permease protein